jgi:CrcB protein
MRDLLWVAAGGALGSAARFGLGLLVRRLWPSGFPVGTLLVNVLGCLVIGALVPSLQRLGEGGRLFVVVGILGGFTTFSAFGLETLQLAQRGAWGAAAAYVAASLVLGLGAVWVGHRFASS